MSVSPSPSPGLATDLSKRIGYRYPLGLPEGSVRAILAFSILGMIWAILLMPEERSVSVPAYLYYLMFLIIGHYFGTRGQPSANPDEWPPLYLPRGSIRLLILVGFAAVFGWAYYAQRDFFAHLRPEELTNQGLLVVIILGAFFLGILIARLGNLVLAGPRGLPAWFQDIQSWIALLSMVGLLVVVLWQFVISPSLENPSVQYTAPWQLQVILSSLVAFYFGVRS